MHTNENTEQSIMPISINVKHLIRHCNPFLNSPWNVIVTKDDVNQALVERRLVAQPDTDDHAGRIAYLVKNEAEDAIEIDVGMPAHGCYVNWFIQDGNHRFAAAIISGRKTIKASISGQMDYAEQILGITSCLLSKQFEPK